MKSDIADVTMTDIARQIGCALQGKMIGLRVSDQLESTVYSAMSEAIYSAVPRNGVSNFLYNIKTFR